MRPGGERQADLASGARYGAAGLSFATLKNVDASIGRVLTDAAGRAGCVLHAAILQVEETAAVEYDGWDHEVEDIGDHEYEYVEPIETSCRLDPGRPDSQRLTEASGNEGATLERLYRRAALVLWRNEDAPRILAEADAASLVALLAETWRADQEDAPGAVPIADLAFRVAEHWPPPRRFRGAERNHWIDSTTGALHLLCEIGNRDAVLRFLGGAVTAHYHPRLNGAVVTAAADIGAGGMVDILCAMVRSGLTRETGGIVDLAERLCTRLEDNGEDPAPGGIRCGPWSRPSVRRRSTWTSTGATGAYRTYPSAAESPCRLRRSAGSSRWRGTSAWRRRPMRQRRSSSGAQTWSLPTASSR
ncbi:MAG: hypothetical protein OXI75_09050 [Rhodospirillales bacterium]|nr:hypothetical protein [Rhodospirillales bacterium]